MNDDLISKQDTLKCLCKKCWEGDESTGCSDWKCIEYRIIEDMPSADRPTGKWIMSDYQREEDTDNGNYLYNCSVCGRSDLQAKTQEVPYCWWCGSRNQKE